MQSVGEEEPRWQPAIKPVSLVRHHWHVSVKVLLWNPPLVMFWILHICGLFHAMPNVFPSPIVLGNLSGQAIECSLIDPSTPMPPYCLQFPVWQFPEWPAPLVMVYPVQAGNPVGARHIDM